MSDEIQFDKYDDKFFKGQINNQKKKNASEIISKLVIDMCGDINSVVDIGCGVGTWPRAFMDKGIKTVHAVDGDYINKDLMLIPAENFYQRDLREPIILERQYDLACSLEVAEHLPLTRAKSFVEDLTKLAPIVLFSAAIPDQGGDNHINEMWQHHWARLFSQFDYQAIDFIRPIIWSNTEIQVCYRQNTILYVHDSVIQRHKALKKARELTNEDMLPLVHPRTLVRLKKKWLNEKK
jgi:hypothetical protein